MGSTLAVVYTSHRTFNVKVTSNPNIEAVLSHALEHVLIAGIDIHGHFNREAYPLPECQPITLPPAVD